MKIKPVEYNEHICFKCLQEKENIHTYRIWGRGYGSIFDNDNTTLQLCDDCNQEELETYFNEEPEIEDEYCENYKHEDDIVNFVKTLPIQGQELFNNTCASDNWLKPQDWIDIELKIAPDEVYKKYNMYSPNEIKAYKERFPNCKQVYKKVYADGSSGCRCDLGAFGDKDGNASEYNYSDECYYCKQYGKRIDDIEVVYETIIHKSDIKLVTMQEWVCPKCGNINYTHEYLEDDYSCERCFENFTLI